MYFGQLRHRGINTRDDGNCSVEGDHANRQLEDGTVGFSFSPFPVSRVLGDF